jgi:hypothetical protein
VTSIDYPTRYRAAILAFGGFLTTVLLQLGEALTPGRPLGGIEIINLFFSALVMLAVYWPANPWAKFASAVAGAVGQTVISALTDDRLTNAELVTIAVALLAALGVGTLPNHSAPAAVVASDADGSLA